MRTVAKEGNFFGGGPRCGGATNEMVMDEGREEKGKERRKGLAWGIAVGCCSLFLSLAVAMACSQSGAARPARATEPVVGFSHRPEQGISGWRSEPSSMLCCALLCVIFLVGRTAHHLQTTAKPSGSSSSFCRPAILYCAFPLPNQQPANLPAQRAHTSRPAPRPAPKCNCSPCGERVRLGTRGEREEK